MPGAGVGLPKAMPDRGAEFTLALSQTEPLSTQRPSTAARPPRAEIARERHQLQHLRQEAVDPTATEVEVKSWQGCALHLDLVPMTNNDVHPPTVVLPRAPVTPVGTRVDKNKIIVMLQQGTTSPTSRRWPRKNREQDE